MSIAALIGALGHAIFSSKKADLILTADQSTHVIGTRGYLRPIPNSYSRVSLTKAFGAWETPIDSASSELRMQRKSYDFMPIFPFKVPEEPR